MNDTPSFSELSEYFPHFLYPFLLFDAITDGGKLTFADNGYIACTPTNIKRAERLFRRLRKLYQLVITVCDSPEENYEEFKAMTAAGYKLVAPAAMWIPRSVLPGKAVLSIYGWELNKGEPVPAATPPGVKEMTPEMFAELKTAFKTALKQFS